MRLDKTKMQIGNKVRENNYVIVILSILTNKNDIHIA